VSGESLAFDIFAIDRASEVFRKIGENGEEMGAKFGKIGELIGKGLAVASTAIIGIGATVAKAGLDDIKASQAAQAQLAAGVKSTGGAAGISVGQMQDLAKSIQDYSGQNKDAVAQSEALLLTFTNIKNAAGANNDIFTQATKATTDMAARMGTDASSSAILLGKALNDPVKGLTALTRVGVSFSDAQKAQIAAMVKTGDTMGAQKVILAELNKEFGGSAKAAGETLPGQMARAKNAFSDVSGEIAAGLLPVITTLLSFFNDKLLPGLKTLYDIVAPHVVAVFDMVKDAVSGFIGAFTGQGSDALANFSGPVANGIMSAATMVRGVFDQVGQIVTTKLLPAFQSVGQLLISNVVPLLLQLWDAFQAKILPVLQQVAGFVLGTVVPALVGLWTFIAANLVPIFAEVWNVITSKVLPAIGTLVSDVLAKVVPAVQGLIAHLKENKATFEEIFAVVKKVTGVLVEVVGFIVSKLAPVLGTVLGVALQVVIGVIKDTIDIIVSLVAAGQNLYSGFETVFDGIRQVIEDVWEAIQPILDTMKRTIDDTVGSVGKVASIAGKIGGGISHGIGSVVSHLPFASGGFVPGTGDADSVPAMLTPGEYVMSRSEVAAARNGGGDIHVTLTLDGQVLHEALIPYAQRYKNRNGTTGLS
jgi:phage-related protein